MMPGTLTRYFGMRFFNVVVGTFVSLFALILMIWIGVRPNTFLRKMTPSVQQLLQIVHKTDASKAMIARLGGGH